MASVPPVLLTVGVGSFGVWLSAFSRIAESEVPEPRLMPPMFMLKENSVAARRPR